MKLACYARRPGQLGHLGGIRGGLCQQFLDSRAAYARAANKPWMLEEVGMEVRQPMSCGCSACIACCPFPSNDVAVKSTL